jgi:hypothetical protein
VLRTGRIQFTRQRSLVDFSAQAEKSKSTLVLQTLRVQPAAMHPVCLASNNFQSRHK